MNVNVVTLIELIIIDIDIQRGLNVFQNIIWKVIDASPSLIEREKLPDNKIS